MFKFFVSYLLFFCFCFNIEAQVETKPNFIFIVVDDLNDYIEGFTDQPQILTPNIKQLVTEGTLFLNAYGNATGCAPSRTSFFSGKDLHYTKVYNNEDYINKFRENFTVEENNAEVFTIPQILKDSAGYFTFAINKLFHNPNENDFDKHLGTPMCEKTLSWNRMIFQDDSDSVLDVFSAYAFDPAFDWGMIPDSLEYLMEDYIGADTAIEFIHQFAAGIENTCEKPFFLALGFFRPHSERFIPQKYYPEFYLNDIYEEPFIIPYNHPVGSFPYNGIVMPNQPNVVFQDYYNLPENGIAQTIANNGKMYDQINEYIEGLITLPEIASGLSDAERKEILFESVDANISSNYIAAVQFIDAQIGRVMDALNAYPALKENTIIILISDNGYSLGEKRHWTKWSLWEPDIRVPLIIIDPSKSGNQISNATVSLIDLFPTILEMAGVEPPLFSDGSKYIDGHSMIPYLIQPTAEIEAPVITSYKKNSAIGSCFPHYSIRNKRFHYLRYRDNNDGTLTTSSCDSNYVSFEEELYEIGINRETDPYEWNNLIHNEDYKKVVEYLSQFIPDSVLYLKRTFKPLIQHITTDCRYERDAIINFSFDLFDTLGNLISAPDQYLYKWSDNLTDNIFYGNNYDFNLQTISDFDFDANNRLIVYLEMLDTLNNYMAGFDMQYIYINPDIIPKVDFDVVVGSELTVYATNIEFEGTYNSIWWDFGEGTIVYGATPGPYTYQNEGTYTITCYVQYGNISDCIVQLEQTTTVALNDITQFNVLTIFPNPTTHLITVFTNQYALDGNLYITDVTGKLVTTLNLSSNTFPFIQVDVSTYAAGIYFINHLKAEGKDLGSFVVLPKR